MKMKEFNPKNTPSNCLILVYFQDWDFRIAAYKNILPTRVLQGTGTQGDANGDFHETNNTFWSFQKFLKAVISHAK